MATTDNPLGGERLQATIEEIKSRHGAPPWSERVVLNEQVQATLICQGPGQGNQRHWHASEDEFWVVLEGNLVWQFDDMPAIHAKTGDVVLAPRRKWHHIYVEGDGPSLRLAIVTPDVPHLYE